MIDKDCVVLVFTKSPVAGLVKTRLIPEIGQENAAGLYRDLIKRTLDTAGRSGKPAIQIWSTPDIEHPDLVAGAREVKADLKLQRGRDLGERMYNAADEALRVYKKIIIIGCDCPTLIPEDIVTAARMLDQGSDLVLGPCDDGGYYLLAAKSIRGELFEGITWGTETVFADTVDKIRQLGMTYGLLDQKWDLDNPEDLQRYYNL